MKESTKIFNELVNEVHAEGGREAVIDFTVNGMDFSLSVANGVMILWYDDEAKKETLFSTETRDRKNLIAWLEEGIGEAIQ